jgi:hypothetical protein
VLLALVLLLLLLFLLRLLPLVLLLFLLWLCLLLLLLRRVGRRRLLLLGQLPQVLLVGKFEGVVLGSLAVARLLQQTRRPSGRTEVNKGECL